MADKIVVYGHPGCPQVGPLLGTLKQAGVDYTYINIWQDEAARAEVRSLNDGNESVPTLVFPDGGVLSEPPFWALEARLNALGYRLPWWTWLTANVWVLVIGLGVLLAILRALGVI